MLARFIWTEWFVCKGGRISLFYQTSFFFFIYIIFDCMFHLKLCIVRYIKCKIPSINDGTNIIKWHMRLSWAEFFVGRDVPEPTNYTVNSPVYSLQIRKLHLFHQLRFHLWFYVLLSCMKLYFDRWFTCSWAIWPIAFNNKCKDIYDTVIDF